VSSALSASADAGRASAVLARQRKISASSSGDGARPSRALGSSGGSLMWREITPSMLRSGNTSLPVNMK
jgi:hypothetical protein